MRTYEVTVKVPAYMAREGAGKLRVFKIDAGSRTEATRRAMRVFTKEEKPLDRVGRTVFLTVVRVN